MYKTMTTNLMVENVNKSINFYKNILGFEEVISVPSKKDEIQFAILSKDGFALMIQEKNNFIEEYPVLKTLKVQPSVSLYIEVDNLDTLYNELKEKININTEMHASFYGKKEFAIIDVDDYVITFTENKED